MYVLTGPLRTTAAILTALQVRPILVVKWYGKAVNLPLCILFVDLPSILYKTNTGKCQTLHLTPCPQPPPDMAHAT